jgi:altronate hydrolase
VEAFSLSNKKKVYSAGIQGDRGLEGAAMDRTSTQVIRLNLSDNVVVARVELSAGARIPEEMITCQCAIPPGHKIATAPIKRAGAVRKYGQIIGFATRDIPAGEHVHTHNLEAGDFTRDYAIGSESKPTNYVDEGSRADFMGILRPDGRVATRNYIGVLSTVNCSASVARKIADSFTPVELSRFPNIDGVAALCHGMGCAMPDVGEGIAYLQQAMAGYIRNPNFAGVLVVGLGCEGNQMDALFKNTGLEIGPRLQGFTIQDVGGTEAAVREGVARIRHMLQEANLVERVSVPVSNIILGLECGGSDGYSGITANPALGAAVDLLVSHGGTAILSETPEIYGAEHLLTRRASSKKVARKLISLIRWWHDYTDRSETTMDNQPTPGNKAGGITTILEKSLGAAAKGGSTDIMDVLNFARTVTAKGLVFMDTPGYDPVSVTGMVAGGATVICFTTGRGSVFGCKPVPVIKLASNTALYDRMKEDMDIDCGPIVEGKVTVEEIGVKVFSSILDTASGKKTKSEILGIGDNEFVPWHLGAVM